MSTIHSTPAVLPLGKRSAFEGVARRQGCRRNPARTTPRSSLRTPTNPPRDHAQRGVEKCGRTITNSETPHLFISHQTNGIRLNELDRQRPNRTRYHEPDHATPEEVTAA